MLDKGVDNKRMKRSKEQGIYRLEKAIKELYLLEENIKDIKDDIDKDNTRLEIEEVRWLVKEGLQDLLNGV
jgi:3-hydroxyacyl-CoA dehydrogenase